MAASWAQPQSRTLVLSSIAISMGKLSNGLELTLAHRKKIAFVDSTSWAVAVRPLIGGARCFSTKVPYMDSVGRTLDPLDAQVCCCAEGLGLGSKYVLPPVHSSSRCPETAQDEVSDLCMSNLSDLGQSAQKLSINPWRMFRTWYTLYRLRSYFPGVTFRDSDFLAKVEKMYS